MTRAEAGAIQVGPGMPVQTIAPSVQVTAATEAK
jgi:hypothetical protein